MTHPAQPLTRNPGSFWGHALAVWAVAVAVYAQTVTYEFAYDDVWIVQSRSLFQQLDEWRQILTASWWPNALYRPFTALTFAANWTASGGDPSAFHAVNVVLHGAASVLTLALARRVLAPAAALAAALVFAVHPVHVEAVANVVGRAELLATAFGIAAVLCYWWDGRLAALGEHASWRRVAASLGTLAALLLALGSKESAFAVPALVLAVDWFEAQREGLRFGEVLRRHWLLWLAVVTVAFGWLELRAAVVEDLTGTEVAPGLEGLGLVGRTVVMLPVVLHYVRLLFWPARLSVDYSPAAIEPAANLTLPGAFGAAVVLGTGALAVAARRRAPVASLAVVWIAATLFIVANVIVPTGVLLAERTLYLPSVGAALLVGWGWERWLGRRRGVAAVVLALLLVAGAARTVTRNPIWRNNGVLFPQVARDAPASFRAPWMLAMVAIDHRDLRAAERLIRQAIQVHPLATGPWNDLARVMTLQRRHAEAARYFWAAWRLQPTAAVYARLAIEQDVLAGQVDSASARLAAARQVSRDDPDLKAAAAQVALARGDSIRALSLARQAAWQRPTSLAEWRLAANVALHVGRCPEAMRAVARIRTLAPNAPDLPRLEWRVRDAGCGAPPAASASGPSR